MSRMADDLKPRFKVFFELIADTQKALKDLKIIIIKEQGIQAVYKYIKTNRLKPAHGSIRLDKDQEGTVFIQEFRPSPSIFQRGEFYSISAEKPFWEITGTAIIRLARRKRRFESEYTSSKKLQYCVILQGGLDVKYLESLIEKGLVSYNIHQDHLWEAPIFTALSILNQIKPDQILELKLINKRDPEKELNKALFRLGKSVRNIACLVGKNGKGDYYTAPHFKDTEFPINICNNKVVPIEISKEINRAHRVLLQGRGLIILDELTFDELATCLKNRESFYYNVAQS